MPIIALLCCLGRAAIAATVDFGTATVGANLAVVDRPSARLVTTANNTIYVIKSNFSRDNFAPDICALALSDTCTGPVTLLFIGPPRGLRFQAPAALANGAAVAATAQVMAGGQVPSGGIAAAAPAASGAGYSTPAAASSGAFGGGAQSAGVGRSPSQSPDNAVAALKQPDPAPRSVVSPLHRLNFDDTGRARYRKTLKFDNLVITGLNQSSLFIYHSGDWGMPKGGGVCGFDARSYSCTGDLQFDFLAPVTDLSFRGYFAAPTDSVLVLLFADGNLLGRKRFFGNDSGTILFDFSAYAKIDMMQIFDRSHMFTHGMAFGDFKFRLWSAGKTLRRQLPDVPLPASVVLLAGALTALGATGLRRRRRQERAT